MGPRRSSRTSQWLLTSSHSMPSLTTTSPFTAPTLQSPLEFTNEDEHVEQYTAPTPPKKRKTNGKHIKKEPHSDDSNDGQSPACSTRDLLSTFVEGLKYLTLEAANERANDRVSLLLDAGDGDDLADVELDAHRYVLNLVRAFTAPAVDEPTEHRLDQTALASWRQYQSTHLDKVSRYAATQDDLIEICAWKVYGIVIDFHQNGLPRLNNIPIDRKSKCSERLVSITKSITNYAIVRYDVLRLVKLNELVASPYNYISRKITNWKNNEHKARRDQENADAAAKTGTAYRKVLGDHSRTHGSSSIKKKKRVPAKTSSSPVTPPCLIKLETSFSSQDGPHTPFAQMEATPSSSSATKRKLIDEAAGELCLPSYFDPFNDLSEIDPVLRQF